MSASIPILVTASAGDFGQAIIKALRLSRQGFEIHGCDLAPQSYAEAFVSSYHQVPRADAPQYRAALQGLCQALGIRAVVPASEQEIETLGGQALSGIPVVSQPRAWVSTFGDKLTAMQAIQGQVPLALFADGTNAAAIAGVVKQAGFPVVVKSRRSHGAKSVRVAHTQAELDTCLAEVPLPLVQAYLAGDRDEYSIGVFRCDAFESAIAFRRTLGPGVGLSLEAECVDAPAVCAYALQVARAAKFHGSVNVQLRVTPAGPRLLEINPRFSSLVSLRAACGFADAEWSLALALGLPVEPPSKPYRRLKFHRFFHEMIDAGEGFGVVSEWALRTISLGAALTHDAATAVH